MGKSLEELLREQETLAKDTATDNRKIRKFLKIAIPIFAVEILTVIALIVYFIALPKNTLTIKTNREDAVVYINGENQVNLTMENPKEVQDNYSYVFDLELEMPQGSSYLVTFRAVSDDVDTVKVNCIGAIIEADGYYSKTIKGGEKDRLITGITILSKEKPKNFDVVIEITITKKIS